MTNELEKTFFDTFGIEPKDVSTGECKYKITPEFCGIDCLDCKNTIKEKTYPQITDRILLELICIWNNACLYLEDDIAPINYKTITETVLEYFVDIDNFKFVVDKEVIKHQVRTLFEEG